MAQMTYDNYIRELRDILTGGANVELEVRDDSIKRMLDRAFRKVVEWYEEDPILQTVPLAGAAPNCYIDKSSLSFPVDTIRKIYPIDLTTDDVSTDYNGLLGIEGHTISYTWSGEQVPAQYYYMYNAAWRGTQEAINIFNDSHISYQDVGNKILLNGNTPGGKVTVEYTPLPENVEQVLAPRIQEWITEYATALVSKGLGRVRGKYRGGDINMEMDYSDLLSEGITDLSRLEDQLPGLHFHTEK